MDHQPTASTTTPFPRALRGVSYDPQTCMWRARIYCMGKHVTLGRYATAQEAAFVHDRAAYFIHGDDAQTNYGIEAARLSNERKPPIASWRVMNTLERVEHECKMRKAMAFRGGIAALSGRRQAAGPVSSMMTMHPYFYWKWTQSQVHGGALPPMTWPDDRWGEGHRVFAKLRTRAQEPATLTALLAIANRLAV